ncbi:DoxX family protein [Oleidesulfovibrio alaskensis G20]|uniref:DoxX family protein n=2 Tax=Oleidesulfovibrio alaskensis TaxID=58180 RepID=Q314P0_OLEA2|nr:DoxX family protein [Oleidesulfovibrio alaskensis G20]
MMLRFVSSVWTYRVVRLALAVLFLVAGAMKLADMQAFARVIEEYRMLPQAVVPWVAFLLPLAEVAAGVLLFFDRRGGLTAVTAMLLLFLGVLGYAMAAGLTIGDCGCFEPGDLPEGVEDGSALRDAFVRDVVMLAGACHLYWWRMRVAGRVFL